MNYTNTSSKKSNLAILIVFAFVLSLLECKNNNNLQATDNVKILSNLVIKPLKLKIHKQFLRSQQNFQKKSGAGKPILVKRAAPRL